MPDLITQNPIIAFLLVIVVPLVAAIWKIFHELHVKPRDFRIDSLKEEVARVSSQLAREMRVVSAQGHVNGSSRVETQPTGSTPLEIPQFPIGQPTQGSHTPADSLAIFYDNWSDPSITHLQKQQFERYWTGKDVRWVVSVSSISEASHGNILVAVRDGARNNFSAPRAILFFSDREADVLLSLRSDDRIVVTGTIRDFFLGPQLNALTIERA